MSDILLVARRVYSRCLTSYWSRVGYLTSYWSQIGLGDVLIGAAATISDYNGTSKASHIKDKLVEMAYLNENIVGTSLCASKLSTKTLAGNYMPDVLMANVCKHNVTRFPYEIARLAQDLAGMCDCICVSMSTYVTIMMYILCIRNTICSVVNSL